MKDNGIGKWNPAWGPEPVKVKEAVPPKFQDRWHRVTCWSCESHPSFVVFGPTDGMIAKYDCAVCGLPMSVAICSKRELAEIVPSKHRRGRQELGHASPDWLWTVALILFIIVMLRWLGAI